MSVTIEQLTAFIGWCAVINSAMLLFLTLANYLLGNWAVANHARFFSMSESETRSAHFSFLANYKLIILSFNIVPYLALKIFL